MLDKGDVTAGYRIDRVLGRGGMGVVYEATQLSLGRTVALKVLAAHLGDDAVFAKRFRREGRIQAGIDHPHIVAVHEAGESEHGLFLAMRLIRGPTLKDMIVARELDAGRALRILGPVAQAIDTAHEAGLIHRDIKPQNILVGGRDHAYLSDFGLTQAAGDTALTDTGHFVGTYDYISPEQIKGERATAASDIYSFGGVLYEALTGIVPYPKPSRAAVLYAQVALPPPRVTDERPELPHDLDLVVARAMAKDPAGRYPSAFEMVKDAERAFGRRLRATIQPPRPVESGAEIGVRPGEAEVSTDPEVRHHMGAAAVGATRVGSSPSVETLPLRDARRVGPLSIGVAATLLAAIVAAIALGAVLGGTGSGSGTRSAAKAGGAVASVGPLEVSYPVDWRRVEKVPDVPGLKLREPIVLAPPASEGSSRLVAGHARASGPTLLPAALRRQLGDVPAGTPVRLGDKEALRYDSLKPRGSDTPVRLYAVPDSAGVATIACLPRGPRAQAFLSTCDRIAASMILHGPDAFPVGADPAYGRALAGALARLSKSRGDDARRLRDARTPDAQARAARGLARAYAEAVASLRGIDVPPQVRTAHADLVAAVERTVRSYRQLAAAAARSDRPAYRDARRSALAGERQLRRVLASLEKLGYSAG